MVTTLDAQGFVADTEDVKPFRHVFKITNEPDCQLAVGWMTPEGQQPGAFWFALVDTETNEVRDGMGANGDMPCIEDLIEHTRFYVDWQQHQRVYHQLRGASLAGRPREVQELMRRFCI